MPVAHLLDPVEVFEVLPQTAATCRLPASPVTVTSTARRSRALSSAASMITCQLAVAADERRLEPGAAPHAADAGDDAQRRPRVHWLLAALDLMRARVLIGDRRLARAARHIVDEHRPRRRDRLQPRGRVDRVAEHHPLGLGADLDRRVAGQHAGADPQLRHPDLIAERASPSPSAPAPPGPPARGRPRARPASPRPPSPHRR